jgi:hypothetical protein
MIAVPASGARAEWNEGFSSANDFIIDHESESTTITAVLKGTAQYPKRNEPFSIDGLSDFFQAVPSDATLTVVATGSTKYLQLKSA